MRACRGRWRPPTLAALVCVALLVPLATAAARPRRIVWGSSLAATPRSLAHPAYRFDAEFWNASRGGRSAARAPRAGTIVAIRLKTGSDALAVPIRISVIREVAPRTFRVVTTSTPHWTVPARSPGIHTFSTSHLRFRMPLRKGDLVSVDTPGVKPRASIWFGRPARGSETDVFAARGPTQSQGFTWHAQAHPGVELLLQVIEQPGR